MSVFKQKYVFISLLFISITCVCFQLQALSEWKKSEQPFPFGGILTSIAEHPKNESKFFVSSSRQVFESDNENHWTSLDFKTSDLSSIKRVWTFPFLPESVFVTTDKTLVLGDLKNISWQTVYQDPSKKPLSFAVHPNEANHWFLGTMKGLMESFDAGKHWSLSSSFPMSKPANFVLFHKNNLFIASDKEVFIISSDRQLLTVLDLSNTPQNSSAESAETFTTESDEEFFDSRVREIIFSKRNSQELFLATDCGVFQSLDGGYQWNALSRSGLLDDSVTRLALSISRNILFAATSRGVFAYNFKDSSWTSVFEGLAQNKVYSLSVINEERLAAVTKEGFVEQSLDEIFSKSFAEKPEHEPSAEKISLFKTLTNLEPSVRDVQKHVIRYSDTNNSKISRWHKLSRLAALFPTFAAGRDKHHYDSVSTYGGKFITGPDDTSRSWDADVRWTLGDMVYSSSQTSIDSRAKLMVELRNDLLSEVTRIFYERRRLQMNAVWSRSESEQEHLEKLLRLDELSALLDGMTGGFFLKQLDKIYTENPHLNSLWDFVSAAKQHEY